METTVRQKPQHLKMDILFKLFSKLRVWVLEQLLKESGVDVSPEPNVWGVLDQAEEDNVLSRLWLDKEWIALMRKYAEGSNKALLARTTADKEFWQYQSRFMTYNSLIVRSKRAYTKVNAKGSNKIRQPSNQS